MWFEETLRTILIKNFTLDTKSSGLRNVTSNYKGQDGRWISSGRNTIGVETVLRRVDGEQVRITGRVLSLTEFLIGSDWNFRWSFVLNSY